MFVCLSLPHFLLVKLSLFTSHKHTHAHTHAHTRTHSGGDHSGQGSHRVFGTGVCVRVRMRARGCRWVGGSVDVRSRLGSRSRNRSTHTSRPSDPPTHTHSLTHTHAHSHTHTKGNLSFATFFTVVWLGAWSFGGLVACSAMYVCLCARARARVDACR